MILFASFKVSLLCVERAQRGKWIGVTLSRYAGMLSAEGPSI